MKKQIQAVDDDSSIRELLEFLLLNDYDVVTKKTEWKLCYGYPLVTFLT